jgi:multimeric flavodoxin WrbA
MRIVLLNGNPDPGDTGFDARLRELGACWSGAGHAVRFFDLRTMNIRSCTGCWSCWWKTPGLCATEDDTDTIRATYIHSDLAVLASPLVHGFLSAVLKDVVDKLIPLAHPYIAYENGESMHRARYARHPAVGCVLAKGPADDDRDVEVVGDYVRRMATQFRSRFLFTHLADAPMTEVARAVDGL